MRMLKVGAALGAGAVVLSGCGLVGQSRETQQQEFQQAVKRVEVTLDSGEVQVRAGGDGKVALTRRLSWGNAKPEPREEWQGETFRITEPKCSLNCGIDYVLTVPAGISLSVRTGSGAVSVAGVNGELRLETDSGDITADKPAAELFAHAGSGAVTVTGARSPKADLRTDSGDIRAEFAAAPSTVDAGAGSGAVTVSVPKEPAAYQVSATVDSGRRTVSVTEDKNSPRTISARTDSGDLTVRYA